MSSLLKYSIILHEALAHRFGIKVYCGEALAFCKGKFYEAKADDPLTFGQISIVVPPTEPNTLWIVNKGGANAEDS